MVGKREGETLESPSKKQKKGTGKSPEKAPRSEGQPLDAVHPTPDTPTKTPSIIEPTTPTTSKTVARYKIPVDNVKCSEKTGSKLKSLIPLIRAISKEIAEATDDTFPNDCQFGKLLVKTNKSLVISCTICGLY
jgi:hypothetical protein